MDTSNCLDSKESKLQSVRKTDSLNDWFSELAPALVTAKEYESGLQNLRSNKSRDRSWEIEPEITEVVRFSDCDPFGHLNNAKYLDYFINARDFHLKEAYQLDLAVHSVKHHESWVVKDHRISYLKPARLKEQVRIRSRLLDYSKKETFVESLMLNKDGRQIKALLWTRFAYVNLKTGRSTDHPDYIMDVLKLTKIESIEFANKDFDGRIKYVLDELRVRSLKNRS